MTLLNYEITWRPMQPMLSNKQDNLCKITNFLHKVKYRISLSGVQEITCPHVEALSGDRLSGYQNGFESSLICFVCHSKLHMIIFQGI